MMKPHKNLAKLKRAQTEIQKGNYLASITLCKKILSKDNENTSALKLLTTSLIKLKRFSEAEGVLKKAISFVCEEESLPLLHLLGCNYISQNNNLAALETLEALFNKNGNSKVLLDIALAYFNLGNYEVARDIYLKLIELEPNNHQAKFNLYPIFLHFKDYQNAWVCFHSRFERQEIKDQVHWFAPRWAGESLAGKNILIYPEQGIGDNLAYTGCFAEAIADAKKVHIVCDKRLKGLYQYNFPIAKILSYDDVNHTQVMPESLDVQILAGSLSYLYRATEASFINQQPLKIAEERVQETGELLSNNKLRVGISWFHGRVNDANEHSMALEMLLPLLEIEGVEWVNLQFGDWKKEVKNLEEKHHILITDIEHCGANGDFNQYGSLIANLDLVISASNAALMFASRLGVKNWMFLPGKERDIKSNSLQDTLMTTNERVFYKGLENSWDEVVQQLRKALLSLLDE